MVIGNPDANNGAATAAAGGAGIVGGANAMAHPSGIPQDQIDNIMSGIANTGDVKMNNHRKKLRQRFDIIKKLGQGTYGKVQLGINKETGQEVAIKTIKKCKIEAEADLVRIRREVQIMSSVQHPNIIHIYEVFENREKMVLVMEFAAGGELYDYLSERKVLNEEEARRIFRQVATAVYYCHKHKICHRDLKLENILLDERGNAKIADFGLSNVFDDQRLLATFCGSPLYASPEIVEGTPYQGPEVDCWSLGVLLYTLVYGSMPFDGSNFKRLVKQISQGDYYEPKKPSRASSLIRDMLTVCPRKRASIEQICAHWWVNENDNVSCLDLAEDLANQTPVRLDVLLSLTPTAVTADQLVVPSADGSGPGGKGGERVPRSHSVGSIRDMGANTEAERRIMDMVAAGGEAALMPSPTRTITPAQSPVQTKRKLEPTVSMENAALKKKEKPANNASFVIKETYSGPLTEETPMETEDAIVEEPKTPAAPKTSFSKKDMQALGDMCEQLMDGDDSKQAPVESSAKPVEVTRQRTVGKLDVVAETPEAKEDPTKVIKQFVNKHKTTDLVNAIGQGANEKAAPPAAATAASDKAATSKPPPTPAAPPFVRKCSLQDDSTLSKFNADQRRKSRILETAEKFQQMNATAAPSANATSPEKPKKFSIPGVSVGSFKKEFERKASTTPAPEGPTPGERRAMEQVAAAAAAAQELEGSGSSGEGTPAAIASASGDAVESSDSKTSVTSVTLEDARRSMENSIALLRQAQHESSKEVDQLCAKTESFGVSENANANAKAKAKVSGSVPAVEQVERERKLKNARAIIGNAIQPVIRRPQPFSGIGSGGGGSGGVVGSGVGVFAGDGGRSGGGVGVGDCSSPNAYANFGNGYLSSPSVENLPFPNGNAFGSLPHSRGTPMRNGDYATRSLMTTPTSMAPVSPTWGRPPELQSKTAPNVSALASARQTIIDRLSGGGNGGFGGCAGGVGTAATSNGPSSLPPSVNAFLSQRSKPPASQTQLKQLQHRTPPTKTYLRHSHPLPPQHQHHHSLSCADTTAAAATAKAVNAIANVIANAKTKQANNNSTSTATTALATTTNSVPKPFYNAPHPTPFLKSSPPGGVVDSTPPAAVKTSTASITLKSATLPRRKGTAKTEIQLEIKPRPIPEQTSPPPSAAPSAMRFTTEMQHPVPDLRSAPPREGPLPYSPIKTSLTARATSLEPKEHIIPIQRPPQTAYSRTTSNTTNRSLSRQSTGDSESESTTTNMSQSTITGSSQPIKKSPREFIIPIAVEGGGFITPREGSIEPSESSHTTSSRSTFSRLRPTRRIGSFLNDSGIDEGLPFAKMRTSSINREGGDDDGRFTLHKLRSSRPVKKISQDNDSQSSGEEDDDDGFEILTAENLFSTLLQRVRALTNRMNVNNDLTAGFPNSSRLLNNLRQAQSPFWNQDRFGSRLNNAGSSGLGVGSGVGVGSPWRHSMSRDLGSDMESMFSRTGATLPRGNKIPKTNRSSKENGADGKPEDCADVNAAAEEPLDLADLDLSRLRLSKKDLETLSSIAPGLPKTFQEQLLAKLPPTQARKLSRTLSVQNSPHTTTVKIYKRSVSGGRALAGEGPHVTPPNDLKENSAEENSNANSPTAKTPVESIDRPTTTSQIYRRSLSRPRYDYETNSRSTSEGTTVKSRSNSVCRDDYGKSLCSSYTTDINERYKYYSPYLNKCQKESSSTDGAGSISPPKPYVRDRDAASAALGRPPSGCLSPPLQPPTIAADGGSSSLRRRSSQRRISRFLRPDFFEEPVLEETPYQREKKLRERETQSVLREIRERSREPSRERDELINRKHSLPNAVEDDHPKPMGHHVRNKSMDASQEYPSSSSTSQETLKRNRRSLSRTRDISEQMDKEELADRILQELQLLSAVRSQRLSVPREVSIERTIPITIEPRDNAVDAKANEDDSAQKTSTIKKVKKVKPKEKSTESGTDPEGLQPATTTSITTTVVKKVKKVIKKPETGKNAATEIMTEETPLTAEQPKKESKLKRPKSYPTKESTPVSSKSEIPCSLLPTKLSTTKPSPILESNDEIPVQNAVTSPSNTGTLGRESRLIRPKSYPASKLTPPKESKKVTRSGIAVPSIAEGLSAKTSSVSRQSTYEEKSSTLTPTGKGSPESSSSPESRPTTMKKIIKVTKKSKLAQPIAAITPSSSSSSPPLTNGSASKESSPAAASAQTKEKSPEKKHSKGLLYAIGQKFEKFRDSAMNKEKKVSAVNSSSSSNIAANKSSTESNGSEKNREKSSSLLKKKKSLDGATETTKKIDKNTCEDPSSSKLSKLPNASSSTQEKTIKSEKRSRIDAMIRSLRERSVPRSHTQSESNYIKRAISVEEMPGTFNKNAVNKVLGLFKRFDKEGSTERRVQSTRSTSNIERHIRGTSASPIYANVGVDFTPTAKECLTMAKTKNASKVREEANCDCVLPESPTLPSTADITCPDCIQDHASSLKTTKSFEVVDQPPSREQYQSSKDKRKGLKLDLNKMEKYDNGTAGTAISRPAKTAYMNGNGIYSNLPPYPGAINTSSANSSSQHSMDNTTNNNNSFMTNNNSSSMHTSQTSGYRTSSAHEINRNHLLATPSTENMGNYSSDSRSYQDECGSTSTFLSPTDEPELYFDNWSICSEDNYMLHATPSPTVSRLSRTSQLSSPTRGDASDPNESVIDRIKRRSFYTRFNEKKPKRTSSIVGPSAVRDYYREQQAAVKARSSTKLNVQEEKEKRDPSPNIVHQFLRPLKLSPIGTELKPPIYKSPADFTSSRPRKSLHDIHPTTSPSLISKRYGLSTSDNDYLTSLTSNLPSRYKSTSSSASPYESNGAAASSSANGGSYYSTYNPKRRSSYTLNGPAGGVGTDLATSHIDGYATVGRRSIRPYDQRTMSLLDPSSVSSYRRDTRTPIRDYTSSISRSNSRYGTSSTSRSPTNI